MAVFSEEHPSKICTTIVEKILILKTLDSAMCDVGLGIEESSRTYRGRSNKKRLREEEVIKKIFMASVDAKPFP